MNERASVEDIAEAEIVERSGVSLVWLIPILAVLIGAWLVVKTYSEKGDTIYISFKAAEGLVAGKTKIKYKDVELGEVTEIILSEDLSGVVVTAELNNSKQYLNDKTDFWVVRARFAAGQVSGLGTLFSGAYIGIDPVEGGQPMRNFKGLERPPAVTTDEQGKEFMLHASRLGSLDIGSPVYYRQLKVGEVQDYILDETGQTIDIKIFVHAPYDKYVYEQTQFWNAGGLDMSINADGIKVNTESFVTFLLGGIAFDTPSTLESEEEPAKEGKNYSLYQNLSATKALNVNQPVAIY